MKVPEKDKQRYFEQYKMLADSAEKVSDKRMAANNYFLAINTVLVSLAGFVIGSKAPTLDIRFIKIVGWLGLTISVLWFLIVLSYKQLNSGKFALIHKLEENLPIKLFADEWAKLGKGKDIQKYIPMSHIELLVPVAFFTFYIFLIFTN